ncbi:MAG: hypothetical protein Q9180_002960 [Flavoplaca navasiana]
MLEGAKDSPPSTSCAQALALLVTSDSGRSSYIRETGDERLIPSDIDVRQQGESHRGEEREEEEGIEDVSDLGYEAANWQELEVHARHGAITPKYVARSAAPARITIQAAMGIRSVTCGKVATSSSVASRGWEPSSRF